MTRHGARGSATLYAVIICALLVLAAVVGLQVATVARLQHQVTSAADLAALAASRAAVEGRDGCDAAGRLAEANHADLVACEMSADVATLEVSGTTPRMWGKRWTIHRTARAGPARYGEPGA